MATGALYPGTFDPFTNGHEEMVRRAAGMFSRVVVAVAASPRKQPLFDLQQRIELVQGVIGDLPNVQVVGYEGLTVEVAHQHDAKAAKRAMTIHMKRAEKNSLASFDWLEQERLAGSQRSREFPDSLWQQVLEIERRNIDRGETQRDSAKKIAKVSCPQTN